MAELKQETLDRYFAENLPRMKAALGRLCAIPSVKGRAEAGAPFGKAARQALSEGLAICRENGLAVSCVADAVGEAELPAGGAPGLGILSHLDVVPAGPGWTKPPYELTEENGFYYGRGVIDDKGPFVAALFGLLFCKETGMTFRENVRLIFGTDEENGSADLAEYEKHRDYPKKVFTPDAEFPLIHMEKGRLCPTLGKSFSVKQTEGVLQMTGGEICNAVPGEAKAVLAGMDPAVVLAAAEKKPGHCNFTVEARDGAGTLEITAHGRNAHASTPENGINALKGLWTLLSLLPLPEEQKQAVDALLTLFPVGDCAGKASGLSCADAESGGLTAAFSLMDWNEAGFFGTMDLRFPVSATPEKLTERLKAALTAQGLVLKQETHTPPHAVAADNPFVRTLLAAYTAETGLPGKAAATGGGTYVHGIPGGVAFGAEFPGDENHMHGANEQVEIKKLVTTAKIYARAIAALCCTS